MKHFLPFILFSFFAHFDGQSQTETTDLLKPPLAELPQMSMNEAGLHPDSIQKLLHLINTNPPNDFRGLVIMKEGNLIVEEYFNTYWRSTVHDIRSAAKSITALLLGIAIDKGYVKGTDQSIYDFFPADRFPAMPTEQHLNITLEHLLNMTAGLDAKANDTNTKGNAANWIATKDWLNHLLQLPMTEEPGTSWAYSDACPMLIGAVIEEVTGMTLADFAKENLFDPLGITEFYWFKSPQNRTAAMGNLYLSTLDFAKIGQLVLDKGNWKGEQIISESWVNEIANERIDISHTNPFAKSYGYFWYMSSKLVNDINYEYFFASGNGGNVVIIVPAEQLVVSLTSSAYGQDYGHFRSNNIFEFILNSIIIDR